MITLWVCLHGSALTPPAATAPCVYWNSFHKGLQLALESLYFIHTSHICPHNTDFAIWLSALFSNPVSKYLLGCVLKKTKRTPAQEKLSTSTQSLPLVPTVTGWRQRFPPSRGLEGLSLNEHSLSFKTATQELERFVLSNSNIPEKL